MNTSSKMLLLFTLSLAFSGANVFAMEDEIKADAEALTFKRATDGGTLTPEEVEPILEYYVSHLSNLSRNLPSRNLRGNCASVILEDLRSFQYTNDIDAPALQCDIDDIISENTGDEKLDAQLSQNKNKMVERVDVWKRRTAALFGMQPKTYARYKEIVREGARVSEQGERDPLKLGYQAALKVAEEEKQKALAAQKSVPGPWWVKDSGIKENQQEIEGQYAVAVKKAQDSLKKELIACERADVSVPSGAQAKDEKKEDRAVSPSGAASARGAIPAVAANKPVQAQVQQKVKETAAAGAPVAAVGAAAHEMNPSFSVFKGSKNINREEINRDLEKYEKDACEIYTRNGFTPDDRTQIQRSLDGIDEQLRLEPQQPSAIVKAYEEHKKCVAAIYDRMAIPLHDHTGLNIALKGIIESLNLIHERPRAPFVGQQFLAVTSQEKKIISPLERDITRNIASFLKDDWGYSYRSASSALSTLFPHRKPGKRLLEELSPEREEEVVNALEHAIIARIHDGYLGGGRHTFMGEYAAWPLLLPQADESWLEALPLERVKEMSTAMQKERTLQEQSRGFHDPAVHREWLVSKDPSLHPLKKG